MSGTVGIPGLQVGEDVNRYPRTAGLTSSRRGIIWVAGLLRRCGSMPLPPLAGSGRCIGE